MAKWVSQWCLSDSQDCQFNPELGVLSVWTFTWTLPVILWVPPGVPIAFQFQTTWTWVDRRDGQVSH